MNKCFLQVRIKIMQEDIKRWEREEAVAEHPFAAGYYRGMIMATKPVLREYEKMLEEGSKKDDASRGIREQKPSSITSGYK